MPQKLKNCPASTFLSGNDVRESDVLHTHSPLRPPHAYFLPQRKDLHYLVCTAHWHWRRILIREIIQCDYFLRTIGRPSQHSISKMVKQMPASKNTNVLWLGPHITRCCNLNAVKKFKKRGQHLAPTLQLFGALKNTIWLTWVHLFPHLDSDLQLVPHIRARSQRELCRKCRWYSISSPLADRVGQKVNNKFSKSKPPRSTPTGQSA